MDNCVKVDNPNLKNHGEIGKIVYWNPIEDLVYVQIESSKKFIRINKKNLLKCDKHKQQIIIGDTVKVVNPKLKTFGQIGNVQYVHRNRYSDLAEIYIEPDKFITIRVDNLEKCDDDKREKCDKENSEDVFKIYKMTPSLKNLLNQYDIPDMFNCSVDDLADHVVRSLHNLLKLKI